MGYYTLAEAAGRLGVGAPASLRTYIARGTLRAVKRGRDWFVSDAEIRRYLATKRPAHRPAKNEKPRKR